MLYREIIAVCSQIHTKHTNTAVWAERATLGPPAHTVLTIAVYLRLSLCIVARSHCTDFLEICYWGASVKNLPSKSKISGALREHVITFLLATWIRLKSIVGSALMSLYCWRWHVTVHSAAHCCARLVTLVTQARHIVNFLAPELFFF